MDTFSKTYGRKITKRFFIVIFQTLTSFERNGEEPRLSDVEEKDRVLLLSTPPDTFRGFSYISPNAITSF